jgi:hypothetical protein
MFMVGMIDFMRKTYNVEMCLLMPTLKYQTVDGRVLKPEMTRNPNEIAFPVPIFNFERA